MAEELQDPALPVGETKVVFDEAQQVRVNALLRKEKESAARSAELKFESDKADLLKQIEDLKHKAAHRPTPKDGEDPEALKGKLEELKGLLEGEKSNTKRWQTEAQQKANEALVAREEAKSVQKRIAMTSAAAKAKFVNPEHVVSLTDGHVKWDSDTNSFFVIGDHGQPRLNAAMEPMSLDEFFIDFAAKNKYMVKGDLNPGFGSTPGNGGANDGLGQLKLEDLFGKTARPVLTMELKKQDPQKYAAMRKQAVAKGLVAA